MKTFGWEPTEEELKDMVNVIDQDGDGDISFNEFVWLMTRWKNFIITPDLTRKPVIRMGKSKFENLNISECFPNEGKHCTAYSRVSYYYYFALCYPSALELRY